MLLHRWRPGHELETETVVDHCETSRGKRQALAIGTGDIFAFAGALEGLAGLSRQLLPEFLHLAPAERTEEIAAEDDAPALPLGEAFLDQMGRPPAEGIADFRAEPAFGQCRGVAGEVLPVEPRRPDAVTCRSMSRSERTARATRRRPRESS